MNHRSPSRTRSHTPTCPDDPDEKDERRRTISRIQQDVDRELENADRVLSTVDSFTGSRSQSRTRNVRARGDPNRKDDNGNFDTLDGYRASDQGRSGAGPNDLREKAEECSRSAAQSVGDISGHGRRGSGHETQDRVYERRSGPHGQYSMHEGTGAPGGGYGGPGGPYGSSGAAGAGPDDPYHGSSAGGMGHGGLSTAYGSSGVGAGPGDPYHGSSAGGIGHGGLSNAYGSSGAGAGPGDPYHGSSAGGIGHGGLSNAYGSSGAGAGLGDPYGGSGRPGGGYGGPDDPYGGSGVPGGGYGGPGGPYGSSGAAGAGLDDPYHGSSAGGIGHGGSGGAYGSSGIAGARPSDPYHGSSAGGIGHGGLGGAYGSSGAGGIGHGGSGGPYGSSGGIGAGSGGPYGSSGGIRAGSGGPYGSSGGIGARPSDPYHGSGRPDDPYGGVSAGGMGRSSLGGYPQNGDPYGIAKSPGSPGSAVRTKDPSKTGYDQGRTASGMPFDAGSPKTYGSRGRSPTSVHYSPSTALSAHAESSNRMQGSDHASEARSGLTGGRSPAGAQFPASRAPSPSGFDAPEYERGISPTGTQHAGSNAVSGIMETDLVAMGFEGPGSRPSPIGGSRGSPGRSSRGGSPPDGSSKGTFGMGTKDQSVINSKVCPAALRGKCPAFARDSSPMEGSRAGSGATSGSKRPLSRIEEGPSREEMAEGEAYGQLSCPPEEDFRPPSDGTRSRMQQAREGFTTCSPPPVPLRPRCEGAGLSMYDSMVNDRFQSITPRPQSTNFEQPSMPGRVPVSTHEHHHHDHHDHHDHDGDGFRGKPIHLRDEKAISALNHLTQLQKTPSYIRCRLDRALDLSSCDKSGKDAPKMVKFPEKPCKGMEELQEMVNCEAQDVDSVWYLTSDEKKTYKKPCPKQQKAQENVKSIVKPQTPQTCPKEYTPLEHPDPDDITPELAASMMFSQEQGIKLNECPDEAIKRFFPDIPRPPFPVKLSAVHIVDSNQEDQEEIIEKSASVPSEGVSDSAYTRTMQNKEAGVQKSYDIDFAVGAEKREYVLVAEKPLRYNKVQFRGNLPSWFPGYMQAFPDDMNGMKIVPSPSGLFQKAWNNSNPENIPSSDVIVLE